MKKIYKLYLKGDLRTKAYGISKIRIYEMFIGKKILKGNEKYIITKVKVQHSINTKRFKDTLFLQVEKFDKVNRVVILNIVDIEFFNRDKEVK